MCPFWRRYILKKRNFSEDPEMTLQEIKIKLIQSDTTMTALARRLGYSRQYLYLIIANQKQYGSHMIRIKKALNNLTKV